MNKCKVIQVRRDNKDTAAVAKVIKKEFVAKMDLMDHLDFINHMHAYASAAWVTILVNIGFIQNNFHYSRPRWSQFTS